MALRLPRTIVLSRGSRFLFRLILLICVRRGSVAARSVTAFDFCFEDEEAEEGLLAVVCVSAFVGERDLVGIYEWEFDAAVPEKFPSTKYCKDMRKLYYDQGLEYLKNFAGYDDRKILEVESQFDYEIDDWTFNGVIDLVFEDKDGKLIIQDYKSKSSFKNKREQAEYARQLYLYALFVKKKYGRYPDILRFMMFRKNMSIDIPFNESDLNEALSWARETVKEIRECWDFTPTCDEFFSENLCNHREYCESKI